MYIVLNKKETIRFLKWMYTVLNKEETVRYLKWMYLVLRKKGDGVDTRCPNQDEIKKKKKKGRREVVEFLKQTYVILNKTIKTP